MKLMIIFCILIKALYFIKTQRLYKPVKANTMNILLQYKYCMIHSNIVQIIGEFQSGTAVFAEHKIVYLGAILLISSQHIFADEVGNMSSPILLALKGTCYLSWRECFVLRASCERTIALAANQTEETEHAYVASENEIQNKFLLKLIITCVYVSS